VGDLTSSRRDPPRLIFGEWLNRRARQRAFGRYGGAATKLPAENDDARADEFCRLRKIPPVLRFLTMTVRRSPSMSRCDAEAVVRRLLLQR
jgi:hypothetical protein